MKDKSPPPYIRTPQAHIVHQIKIEPRIMLPFMVFALNNEAALLRLSQRSSLDSLGSLGTSLLGHAPRCTPPSQHAPSS
jgi:hypothetical protein